MYDNFAMVMPTGGFGLGAMVRALTMPEVRVCQVSQRIYLVGRQTCCELPLRGRVEHVCSRMRAHVPVPRFKHFLIEESVLNAVFWA